MVALLLGLVARSPAAAAGERVEVTTRPNGTVVEERQRFDAAGARTGSSTLTIWSLANGQEVRHLIERDATGAKTLSRRLVRYGQGRRSFRERTIRYTPTGKVLKVSHAWRANNTSFLSTTERGPGWSTSQRSAEGASGGTTRTRDRFGNVTIHKDRRVGDRFETTLEMRTARGGKARQRGVNVTPRARR